MALKTRKPSGLVPWPCILLEGEEKAGKSWACAELSASDRVGDTYWIDIGEGAGDEYGAIPGARYEVVEHDGTWRTILAAVEDVHGVARDAEDGKPTVLVIDTMTAEWELLKDWAVERAKGSEKNRKKLLADPDAEVDVSPNYWNDANARHRRLMTLLLTFPGVVVMTARGKEVMETDANGRPVTGGRDYKVEGQKHLAYDASAWVRMTRQHAPLVVGLRSVHAGMRPGVDKPKPAPQFSLEWLIFDVLKCDPASAHVRQLDGDRTAAAREYRDQALAGDASYEDLVSLGKQARAEGLLDAPVIDEHGDDTTLGQMLTRRCAETKPTEEKAA